MVNILSPAIKCFTSIFLLNSSSNRPTRIIYFLVSPLSYYCPPISQTDNTWLCHVERVLGFSPSRITHAHACRVMRCLQPQPRSALMFFLWVAQQPDFTHNEYTYCTLMDILGQAKDFGTIWLLIRRMKKEGLTLSDVPFNLLIRSYGRAGMVDEALTTFLYMKNNDCRPTQHTYSSILHFLFQANQLQRAQHVCREMLNIGLSVDKITCNVLIDGLCKARLLNDALMLLEFMGKQNLSREHRVYTKLINYLCEDRRTDEAYKLLNEMIENENHPNVANYTSVIGAFLKQRDVDRAFCLFNEMKESGCPPNVVTYTTMLNGLFSNGKVEAAARLFSEMKEKGCNPNAVTYGAMLKWLFHLGQVDVAVGLFNQMVQEGCVPSIIVYHIFLNGLCKHNRLDDLVELLKVYRECACDTTIYSTLFAVLIAGEADKAREILKNVIERNETGVT